jgi:ribonuclease D
MCFFQLIYAALDAKVLVMIYDKIQTLAENLGKQEPMSKLESTLKKNRNKPPKAPNKSKYKKVSSITQTLFR